MASNYALIRQALVEQLQVVATYQGHRREMCPHVIGEGPEGNAQCLFYQFGGTSASGLRPDGSPDNWRCIPVNQLTDVTLRPGPWHTASNHSRRQTCVAYVDVEVRR